MSLAGLIPQYAAINIQYKRKTAPSIVEGRLIKLDIGVFAFRMRKGWLSATVFRMMILEKLS
jgi:hypothetical protein